MAPADDVNARILIIDDEGANVLFLEQLLARAGYANVLATTDPRQALRLYQDFNPDAVLLDLLMPYVDGFGVMQQLRAATAPEDYVPIVVLTSDISREKKERALAEGAKDFLTKPLEVTEVLLRLRNLLETRKLYQKVHSALRQERELNELKNRFIAMVSHEIRTPLSVALSSTELLETYGEHWPPEKRAGHLARIRTAISDLNHLVDEVLTLGRVEAGRLAPAPQAVDLAAFCASLLDDFQLTLGAQHALRLTLSGDCAQAWLDPALLRAMLLNLLTNAVKYSPPGSAVTLAVACDGRQAVFTLRDQGIGIPAAAQAHLYEPFFRAENAAGVAGTGLGLAIVKRSVDGHGGNIRCESVVGVGTTFVVTLPLRPPTG